MIGYDSELYGMSPIDAVHALNERETLHCVECGDPIPEVVEPYETKSGPMCENCYQDMMNEMFEDEE